MQEYVPSDCYAIIIWYYYSYINDISTRGGSGIKNKKKI